MTGETYETVAIADGERGLPVPMLYEVPVIWHDPRGGRERLGTVTARGTGVLRIVDPAPSRPPRRAETDMGAGVEPTRRLDRAWWVRRQAGDLTPGHPRVASLVAQVLDAALPSPPLSHALPLSLTGSGGAPAPLGTASRAGAKAILRLDAAAESWAKAQLLRCFAFDGRDVLLREDEAILNPLSRHGEAVTATLELLDLAARRPGRDADLERLAAPVRRAVAGILVETLPAEARYDAFDAASRLAWALQERVNPHGMTRAGILVNYARIVEERDRNAGTVPGADAEAVAGLAR